MSFQLVARAPCPPRTQACSLPSPMALYGLPQGLTCSLVPKLSAESSWRGTAGPSPGTWNSNTLGVPGTYKPWPPSLLQPALSPPQPCSKIFACRGSTRDRVIFRGSRCWGGGGQPHVWVNYNQASRVSPGLASLHGQPRPVVGYRIQI